MTNILFKIMKMLRAVFMRFIYPTPKSLWEIELPLSRKFGFDRGTPLDRVLIENFLGKNSSLIKGRVLEIGNDTYTKRYGLKITKSDILDINIHNKKATIHADLASMTQVADCSFDTIILTHVINLVTNQQEAVREIYRVLAPNGKVILTTACLAPQLSGNKGYTRYTSQGLANLFSKVFKSNNLITKDLGNVYIGVAFWIGMAKEEVPEKYFKYDDPEFPCVATLIAKK